MPFPPPPINTIDWSNIGFRLREVNGHIECHYSKTTGKWTPPEFVTDPILRLHGMAPALNYGQQAFEGQKAHRTSDGHITLFRPDLNAARFAHSAAVASIPEVPESHFMECINAAVSLNAEYVPPHASGGSMYIRPLVIGSSGQLGLTPPEEYMFTVYVLPIDVYHGSHPVDALILEDFDRAAPNGTGNAKVGGNYAPVLRHSDSARDKGYGITLHLDSKTHTEIDEFSTSGFIGVRRDGERITLVVPDSKAVIKSVTSESCLEIGQSFGYKIECRPIKYEEISSFSEVLAAGTAAALVPIKSITLASKGEKFSYLEDEPGPVCLKLLAALKGIQRGDIKGPPGWCIPVTEVDITKYLPKHTTGSNGINSNIDRLP